MGTDRRATPRGSERHEARLGCDAGIGGRTFGTGEITVSRLLWMAVGAAGGIYVYRNGARIAADARDRGVFAVAQDLAGSAAATVTTVRGLLGQANAAAGGPSTSSATWPQNPGGK